MALLGLDLGTSRVKALVCSEEGEILGEGLDGYPTEASHHGWAETSPEVWWEASVAAVQRALRTVREPVRSIAVVGQMHGVVLAARSGEPLRPAILWSDGRTAEEVGAYRRLPSKLLGQLGNEPVVGMAGCSLLWLRRHEPEVYSKARWALQPKDWLRFQLTGLAGADASDASGTLLFSIGEGKWAGEVTAALGLDESLLPPLSASSEVTGVLRAQAAERLGLPEGLPVATGAGDTASALAAVGLDKEGEALLSLGTGGQWVMREKCLRDEVAQRSNVYCAAEYNAWYRLAAAQNVGLALGWVRNLFGVSWEELYGACGELPPDAPFFVPYLVQERWEVGARGGWHGLAFHHSRKEVLASALEGVAFLLRARLDDLRWNGASPTRIFLTGGGSQSLPWRRYLLGILGVPSRVAGTSSLSARGAVLMAGLADGTYRSFSDARCAVPAPLGPEGTDEETMDPGRYSRFLELVGVTRSGTTRR